MSLLMPCETSLPDTGIGFVQYMFYAFAVALITAGISVSYFAQSLKTKIFSLALPIVAAAWIITGNPKPSFASLGEPSVISEAEINSQLEGSQILVEIISPAEFNNPENCGTLIYQWQGGNESSSGLIWSDAGQTTSSPTQFVVSQENGQFIYCYARLEVTMTNSSGNVTSTSQQRGWCG